MTNYLPCLSRRGLAWEAMKTVNVIGHFLQAPLDSFRSFHRPSRAPQPRSTGGGFSHGARPRDMVESLDASGVVRTVRSGLQSLRPDFRLSDPPPGFGGLEINGFVLQVSRSSFGFTISVPIETVESGSNRSFLTC